MRNQRIYDPSTEIQQTLVLRWIKFKIKFLYFFNPQAAMNYVVKVFGTPPKRRLSSKHKQFYTDADFDTLNIRGIKINVYKKGEGAPILFFHGWGAMAYDLRYLLDSFVANGYQVLVPELPGHGRSEKASLNQIQFADVIEEVIQYYHGIHSLEYIISHTWGGVSMTLALDKLRLKGINLPLKKVVCLSLPTEPKAIMDMFCNALDIKGILRFGLEDKIEEISKADGRTMNSSFPFYMDELFAEPKFKLLLIQDKFDNVVDYRNALKFIQKFPKNEVLITQDLGDFSVLKDKHVREHILDFVADVRVEA